MAWNRLDGRQVGGTEPSPNGQNQGQRPISQEQNRMPQTSSNGSKWLWKPLLLTIFVAMAFYLLSSSFVNVRFALGFGLIIVLFTFVVSLIIFRPKKEKQPKPKKETNTPPKEDKPLTEAERVVNEGRLYLEAIRKVNNKIADNNTEAFQQIVRMETTAEKIFDYITDHPEDAPQIRKFMNYYLPTLLKLMESYTVLQDQGIRGENINASITDIEGILHTMAVAFEKQLDHLFEDEALDISADITVLKNMLAQEGLTDSLDIKNEKERGL